MGEQVGIRGPEELQIKVAGGNREAKVKDCAEGRKPG